MLKKTIILKHLKDVGFCDIDCGRVNIPDKLRQSKRHVIQLRNNSWQA